VTRPAPEVETDFPDPLPIGEGELALLEAYLSATIAALADQTPPIEAPPDRID
jgi:hypothetical protein